MYHPHPKQHCPEKGKGKVLSLIVQLPNPEHWERSLFQGLSCSQRSEKAHSCERQ